MTDVRVERLQDITPGDIAIEGFDGEVDNMGHGDCFTIHPRNEYASFWNENHASPQPVREKGIITRYESFPWEDVQEVRTRKGLPLHVHGNPWVWVVMYKLSRQKT